jgi:UDP-3-O-[3-hydroxymyristoyl] glucosamine N-acyltransferase
LKLTLRDIADRFDLSLQGDPEVTIGGIANIQDAEPNDLTFLFSSAYRPFLASTSASAVVVSEQDKDLCDLPCLISSQPRLAWANIAALFDTRPEPDGLQHPSASVSDSAKLGQNVSLGANVVIAAGVTIGDDCCIDAGCYVGQQTRIGSGTRLFPNVTLYHRVELGSGVTVHSGTVIGADGFGYEFDSAAASLVKIPQVFGVVIGDDVEIGAGTTIDRGALNDTVIANGVKLDNQVQVGHGTRIGAHTAISGCTAIAGSTTIGSYCLIGGAVGIIDNITITDQVEVTAMSLVSRSISKKGRYSSGTGLMPGNEWKRNIVGFKQLASLLRRVRQLETGSSK